MTAKSEFQARFAVTELPQLDETVFHYRLDLSMGEDMVHCYIEIDGTKRTASVGMQVNDGPIEDWTGDCSCSLDEQIAAIRNRYMNEGQIPEPQRDN